ncbi:MAG: hypothetical protein AAF458_03365 [Pseudomonadota bacterium]
MKHTDAMYMDRRTRVRVTWLGYAFLAIVALVFAAAFNDNNSLAFMLVFLMLGVAVIAFVKGALNIAHLRLASLRIDDSFANERVPVRGELVSALGMRARFLELYARGDTASGHGILRHAEPDALFTLTLPPQPRGRVEVSAVTIASRYPSGLFEWSVHFDQLLAEALVYPAPVDYLAAPDANGGTRAASAGGEFDELHPWQHGEPLSGICWKTLAKTGLRMRKSFVVEESLDDLLLDWEQLYALTDEQKRSQLCHGVLSSHRQHRNYGLRLPGRRIDIGTGTGHYRRCLAALARS